MVKNENGERCGRNADHAERKGCALSMDGIDCDFFFRAEDGIRDLVVLEFNVCSSDLTRSVQIRSSKPP
mgnify:CR=1 FL=1